MARPAWSRKGPVSRPILSDELFAVLEQELDKGPVAHGRPDQTWTLSRITTLIGRRFHKSYTPQGVAALLHLRVPKTFVSWDDRRLWR
jgi:transposase